MDSINRTSLFLLAIVLLFAGGSCQRCIPVGNNCVRGPFATPCCNGMLCEGTQTFDGVCVDGKKIIVESCTRTACDNKFKWCCLPFTCTIRQNAARPAYGRCASFVKKKCNQFERVSGCCKGLKCNHVGENMHSYCYKANEPLPTCGHIGVRCDPQQSTCCSGLNCKISGWTNRGTCLPENKEKCEQRGYVCDHTNNTCCPGLVCSDYVNLRLMCLTEEGLPTTKTPIASPTTKTTTTKAESTTTHNSTTKKTEKTTTTKAKDVTTTTGPTKTTKAVTTTTQSMKTVLWLILLPILSVASISNFTELEYADSNATEINLMNLLRNRRYGQSGWINGLPEYFSWKGKGMMSSVKHQGSVCGSCWAFATIGVLEAMARKQGKGHLDFSEQQLIDCIDSGCNGGQPRHAFGYIQDYGIVSEADYPVTGGQGHCKRTNDMHRTRAVLADVSKNEHDMQHSIVDGGPLVAEIKVSNAFHNYKSGIFTNQDCNSGNDWHAVIVTGFGPAYWEIKNSCGTNWGEGGYGRVQRGVNWCGIKNGPVAGWLK